MRILLPVLGALLVAILAMDVFQTVFHASGRGGRLSRRSNRLIWAAFRGLGVRRDGEARDRVLALAGPVMVLATLLLWMGLLVLGCFLVYLPYYSEFLFSPGGQRMPWAEALYYSLYTASTLGLGDMVADAEWLRIVSGLQAMSGFALITVAITYLLSVYGQVVASRTLASLISGYFEEGVLSTLLRARESGGDALARWAEGITPSLLAVLQAQFQYPVLSYFRPLDTSRSLAVQLGCLVELSRIVDGDGPGGDGLRAHPSFEALIRALDRYLEEIDRYFLPGRLRPRRGGSDEDAVRSTQERLLHYLGYPT